MDSNSQSPHGKELLEREFMYELDDSNSSEDENDQILECQHFDRDTKVIPKKPSSLIGQHLMPTCEIDPELQPSKKHKRSVHINECFLSSPFINKFKENWSENRHFKSEKFELITEPFKVCVFEDFLQNEEILKGVREEFYSLDWNIRSMDLYEFFQSKDLKYLNEKNIKMVYEFLKLDVLDFVSKITGFELNNISATCSLYTSTDYLLVHDDQRDDRKIAFVLYMTTPLGWKKSNGGALQLLDKDENGQPLNIVRNVLPCNNQLILFPVSNDSFHQVQEVLSLEECRMSINGWFHSKTPPVFTHPVFTPIPNSLFSKNSLPSKEVDIDLPVWISEEYLELSNIKQIQKQIENESEISLRNFLKQDPFNEILQALLDPDIEWTKIGPPNRYNYEIASWNNLPHILERLLNLFQSKQIFNLLHMYTELELNEENASVKVELQKWTPGSYALLTDYDWQEKNELDLILYFGCEGNILGCSTEYVTIEDEIQNALISIEPDDNSLNIVYRDSARFTKYFSYQSQNKCFYVLFCSYSEQ